MQQLTDIDGRTQLFSFFAHPAQHSFSPLMYNTSFSHHHINARYLAFDIEPQHFKTAIEAMKVMNIGGANLSMPFKQTVIPYLDEVSDRARKLQSVNVIKNDHGRLIGDSVDGEGFFLNLAHHNIDVRHQTMTVFGAGGAGRSIIQAGIDQQIAQINVFKRKNQTFNQIRQQLDDLANGKQTEIHLIDYADETQMKASIEASQLIVNTTNLGMGEYQATMPAPPGVLDHLNQLQIVCDVIYSPSETKFLKFAKQKGCQVFNGLGMLIYQGALSFKIFTSLEMPIETVTNKIQLQLTQ